MTKFDQTKLFFIIAPDRSGTTLFQEIMNTFTNFCNNQESRIAGPESPSCWDYVLKHNDFSYLEKFIEDNWTSEFFVEKSPPSISCMPQIIKKYPDANYIFLKRNPKKIVLSQMNLNYGLCEIGVRKDDLGEILIKKGGVLLLRERDYAKRLLRMIKNQIKHKPNFSKKLEIKFEDITHSIENQLDKLSNQFGIEPNLKKARQVLEKPSSSSTFRYGVKDLSDKVSNDIIKLAGKLWGY